MREIGPEIHVQNKAGWKDRINLTNLTATIDNPVGRCLVFFFTFSCMKESELTLLTRKFCNGIIWFCLFSYKKNAMRISRLMKDSPRTPLEKAGDWIEYVNRHGGAQHLRAQVFNIPWYQHYLLDVMAFLVAIVAFVVIVIRWTGRYMCRGCFRRSSEKAKND